MTEHESSDDENSFLNEITAHLPANCSDEQRDAYLQHLLAQWRHQREHSREEAVLMDKYLLTIREHFKPRTPALYDFKQWPINAELMAMLEKDSLDSVTIEQVGIFQSRESDRFSYLDSIIWSVHISFSFSFVLSVIDRRVLLFRTMVSGKGAEIASSKFDE